MVSTSLVTRETSEPRRSVFWVSTDRSWMCRNAAVRNVARPLSVARNSRTLTTYDVTAVSATAAAATSDAAGSTMPVSGPPSARMPRSMVCWTAKGTTTRPSGRHQRQGAA